jgi:hypothetical protein
MAPTDDEARLAFSPKRYEAVRPYVDRLDRQHLHGLNPLVLLQTVVGPHNIPVDMVSPEFWAQGADGDGNTVATVSCPCGREPVIEALGLGTCECDRAFFFTGEEVTVINSQKVRPADLPADPSPNAAA